MRLGMTVEELRQRMSSSEFVGWIAYFEVVEYLSKVKSKK